MKVHKQSSYLTTFSCPFGRYRYIRLSFGIALAGDMFQKKICDFFRGMSSIGTADDILIAGFDEWGKDYNET